MGGGDKDEREETHTHAQQGRALYRPMRIICHKLSVINSTSAPDIQGRQKEEEEHPASTQSRRPRGEIGPCHCFGQIIFIHLFIPSIDIFACQALWAGVGLGEQEEGKDAGQVWIVLVRAGKSAEDDNTGAGAGISCSQNHETGVRRRLEKTSLGEWVTFLQDLARQTVKVMLSGSANRAWQPRSERVWRI